MCYGYVNITDEDICQMVEMRSPGKFEYDVADLEYDDDPPHALLLEYFEDAETISFRNVSIEIADTALRHLRDIHTAYVLHGDLDGDNILLLPDGRVVWVDFDSSETLPRRLRHSLESPRITFLDEMELGWGLFYNDYVSIESMHETTTHKARCPSFPTDAYTPKATERLRRTFRDPRYRMLNVADSVKAILRWFYPCISAFQ